MVLFILKDLEHLLYHLEVVVADSSDPLYHPLYIPMTAFLLKVFDFFPQILWNLSGGCGGMICLREAVLLQEFLLVTLYLLLILKHLIDHFLELSLKFHLHHAHIGRHDVPQFLLNRKFLRKGVHQRLHFHEILHVWDWQLLNGQLTLKVNCLIFVDRFVTQLYHIRVLGIIVFLII